MGKITAEHMAKGRKRFLDGHTEIKSKIEALTQAEASALGVTLGQLRESETMKALRDVAYSKGLDSQELFFSCIADTAEEFAQMVEEHNRAIKSALGQ
jgi:hypothetical protein